MAKQEGIIHFTGTIDGISFYNSKHGRIVRKKGGPDPKKMKTEAKFARVRESGKEFGACAKAAGYIRKALIIRVKESADFRMVSRLTKVLLEVKNQDAVSAKGKRSVGNGLGTPAGKVLLTGFDLNSAAPLGGVLKKAFDVNTATGVISISNFHPKKDVQRPKGASHVRLICTWLRISPESGKHQLFESPAALLPLNSGAANLNLTPSGAPTGNGHDLYFLQICFFQEVNGAYYALKDGSCNSLGVVAVG